MHCDNAGGLREGVMGDFRKGKVGGGGVVGSGDDKREKEGGLPRHLIDIQLENGNWVKVKKNQNF